MAAAKETAVQQLTHKLSLTDQAVKTLEGQVGHLVPAQQQQQQQEKLSNSSLKCLSKLHSTVSHDYAQMFVSCFFPASSLYC